MYRTTDKYGNSILQKVHKLDLSYLVKNDVVKIEKQVKDLTIEELKIFKIVRIDFDKHCIEVLDKSIIIKYDLEDYIEIPNEVIFYE